MVGTWYAFTVFPAATTLVYSDLGSVQLTLSDPWLTSGLGSHRLTFPIETYASWLEQEGEASRASMLLAGTVWAELPGMQWLGTVVPQTLGLCGWRAGGDDLAIELSDQQLLAIEAARPDHGDLRLRLKLEGTLLAVDADVYPIRKIDLPVSIQAARWLELLDQVGRGVGITLFVPSPLTDDGSPLPVLSDNDRASYAQATLRLRQARDHLRGGAYEESVASCRRVLEVLGRIADLPGVKEVAAVPPQTRSQEQRWAAIYYDTKSLTSAAHHEDETTTNFFWTRPDAEGVLAATAGLLRRLLP